MSQIIYIIIALLFSGFFSGMEIAFVCSNRMLAELDSKNAGLAARPLAVFYRNGSNFVSTMLVGNNITLVVYGILFARLLNNTIFEGLDESLSMTLNTIVSTLIVLFTGEFLPKLLFKSNPNKLLTFFAIPAYLCYVILWPVSRFSTMLAHGLMRLVGIKVQRDAKMEEFSKEDLDYLVQESIDNAEENTKDEQREMDSHTRTLNFFQNVLEFSETKVRDCMVPRTEICAVQNMASLDELHLKFVETGKSKIIVYNEDIDHIIGYIHSSEMFKNADNWRDGIREMPFVPETMPASRLMQIFLSQKKSLGVVVDEFGGTSGIVSLEDICEEIFGEIEDEHDKSNLVAKKLSDTEFLLSARQEIDNINEQFSLELPEAEDYMTIGGLILHEYQGFPAINEEINVGKYTLSVQKKSSNKLELIKLTVRNEQ